MSAYRGLYTLKDSAGRITDVQVVSQPDGNSLPLPIDIYRQRNVQPDAESLPDQHQWPERAKQNQLIHEIAVKTLYAAQAANAGRPEGHPDFVADQKNIASAAAQIQQVGGEVRPAPMVPGNPLMGDILLAVDASGLVVPYNNYVF